ncbi:MAG: Holliday junction resolvase RuvX [Ornithinimicrobium sp.]
MRPGVRLGVDVGEVRIGLAASDPGALIATPVATVIRDRDTLSDLERIADEAHTRGVVEVVVGLPKGLSGDEGVAAGHARSYAKSLCQRLSGVSVRLWDERLSTVDAHRGLRMSGLPTHRHRDSVDQVAAVLILQAALDAERATGSPGGEVVTARKARHRGGRRVITKEGNREPTTG